MFNTPELSSNKLSSKIISKIKSFQIKPIRGKFPGFIPFFMKISKIVVNTFKRSNKVEVESKRKNKDKEKSKSRSRSRRQVSDKTEKMSKRNKSTRTLQNNKNVDKIDEPLEIENPKIMKKNKGSDNSKSIRNNIMNSEKENNNNSQSKNKNKIKKSQKIGIQS
jgi:uncharacterized protein YjaZ